MTVMALPSFPVPGMMDWTRSRIGLLKQELRASHKSLSPIRRLQQRATSKPYHSTGSDSFSAATICSSDNPPYLHDLLTKEQTMNGH